HAPAIGNAALHAEVEGQHRLHPVWVVMPSHTGELPESDQLVGAMLEHGVRMARMFPSAELSGHRFALADWCAGSLLAALAERRVPVAIDFTLFRRGEPPWDMIVEVCTRHPRLPVVLIDAQGRNNRTLYAVMAHCPNLHLETAGFNVHRGIEDVCRRFGPERLLFGSGYPLQSMGGAVLQLDRADIDEDQRDLIASGNLRALLAAVPTKADRDAT
ncbi:MAG: amidohydrolase family protein, partial [Thermocrispum sp.]